MSGNSEGVDKVRVVAKSIYDQILEKDHPKVRIPLRSLTNVDYHDDVRYFTLKGKYKRRTLTANTAKTFAQTLRMMALSKKLIETADLAMKRDVYYQSKGWDKASFSEQVESDTVMDDIEAMVGVNREKLGFVPDEDGSAVAGELVVVDRDPQTGEVTRVDCSKLGTGAYSIPNSVEHFEFETKAKFVLAIETAGMWQRFNYHKFWKKHNCIIVSLKGVPSRATRRFLRKLSDQNKLPIYVFTDGDPYGYLNIYRTLKVGSGNAAHINEFFCVPQARFIGVTPQDIIDYDLPTHPLKDVDIKRVEDGIKNDPFIENHDEWLKALKQLVKMKKRAEQQAFAAKDLNYVMDEYLPAKLKDQSTWLP
ncbi:MAG: DNA topoisomerase VI [Candidatus Woesearchaeota archaeon]